MRVSVALEQRFMSTPDGKVWTRSSFGYDFWQRYLDVFDEVNVVARVRGLRAVPPGAMRAGGHHVSFSVVPYYVGPWQYLMEARRVRHAVTTAISQADAVVLRVPGRLSTCAERCLKKTGRPYGVEVVGDPYDVFNPGSFDHPLRPYFRWSFTRQLRHQCRNACACSYVTKKALQRRYPATENTLSLHCSDVRLPEAAVVASPRPPRRGTHGFTLIGVGTMAQLYKRPDVLIDAVAACVRDGMDLRLVLVGDGKFRKKLESRAAATYLGRRLEFLGQLPAGEAVRDRLDQADVFVLPSSTEGLPRAMIEAMARGLPCIGSAVGGIPELLLPEDMVPSSNVAALAGKIREVISSPERMARMSERNFQKAKQYCDAVLCQRRIALYRRVKESTEIWLTTNGNR